MLKQKFQVGDRVTTPAAIATGDKTIWIVDKVELRVRLGREPYLAYGTRKLNSYDEDSQGVGAFYFSEDELVGIPTEED